MARVCAAATAAIALLAPAIASADAAFERTWPTRSRVIQEPCCPLYYRGDRSAAAGCQARADALGFTLLGALPEKKTI